VANLLLARALRRRREIAVRLALGVSRGRLISQLLTEGLVLSVAGGVLGLLIAQGGGAVLRALFLPRSDATTVVSDPRTLLFTAAAVVIAAVLTGIAPALQARRDDMAATLKAGQREGTYVRSHLRTALLVLQGAMSVVLLIGAGLFVRSLSNVTDLRLGYDVDEVLYVSPNMRGLELNDTAAAVLRQRLLEEVKTIPGVVNATRQMTVPFWWSSNTDMFVPGIDSANRLGDFMIQAAGPEYFETFGTRIVRGRRIGAEDRKGGPLVAVVSEAMANRIWPGKDAIGECFRMESATAPCISVVGISENIRTKSPLSGEPEMHYYLPTEQFQPHNGGLYVRTRGSAVDVQELVRKRLQLLMPGASYVTVAPMQEIVDPSMRSWKLGATMFVAFGLLALVLAAIGLYSVIAYNVVQRTHELGVRVALGAQVADVLRLVLGEGMRMALVGLVLGTGIALWAVRWVAPLLFDVESRDPAVFVAVGSVLLVVSVVATLVPALRASRVDPSVALRTD
jgi:putative ABC transport system permease protein